MGLAQKLSNSIIIRRKVPPRLLVILGMLGLAHMLYGGMWDASSHILKAPEFFWSIQHVAVYLGVAMITVSAVAGGIILIQNGTSHKAATGIRLLITGSLLQLAAGYADSVSHDMWGIDGLLSWSHQILETGLVLSAVGIFLVLKSGPDAKSRILLPCSIAFVLMSASWLAFNLFLLPAGHVMCIPVYEIFSSGCAIA